MVTLNLKSTIQDYQLVYQGIETLGYPVPEIHLPHCFFAPVLCHGSSSPEALLLPQQYSSSVHQTSRSDCPEYSRSRPVWICSSRTTNPSCTWHMRRNSNRPHRACDLLAVIFIPGRGVKGRSLVLPQRMILHQNAPDTSEVWLERQVPS